MKTLLKSFAILTILALFNTPSLVRAQDDSGNGDDDQGQDVSFQTFYDQLNDQGTWIQTDDYGYVFQPNVTDPDWQPYSDGSWVDSDAGFTWVSDEPWGWATYHYGRWANIDGMGWVWVPGYRWAPAWVSWRYGGGYCGWAPLPPETLYGAEYGEPGVGIGLDFHFGDDVDVAFHIGAGYYNFVRVEDMGERNYRGHIVDRHNNFAIINHTNNITNFNVVNSSVHDRTHFRGISAGGPSLNEINAHSRQHIQTVQLAISNQPGKSTLQGNTLAVFAPRVNPGSLQQAKPAAVAQTINHPTFNRGDSISKPLAVTRQIQATPATPEAIHAAEQAQAATPAGAKIATPRTPTHTGSTHPFTSLVPATHANPANSGTQSFNNGNPNMEHRAVNPAGTVNTPGNQPNVIKAPTPNPEQKAPTFHPENQNNGGNQPPANTPPVHTFHTENPNNGDNHPPANTPPVHTFHQENQDNGGGNQHPNPPPAQVFHPQNQGGGGGNGGGQGGNPHPSVAPAPAAVHPANSGGQGGNNSSGGNEKKDDKDKKPQGQ